MRENDMLEKEDIFSKKIEYKTYISESYARILIKIREWREL